MLAITRNGHVVFVPSRLAPGQVWESRQNYVERTGLNLNSEDWFELVAASVIRHGGVVTGLTPIRKPTPLRIAERCKAHDRLHDCPAEAS